MNKHIIDMKHVVFAWQSNPHNWMRDIKISAILTNTTLRKENETKLSICFFNRHNGLPYKVLHKFKCICALYVLPVGFFRQNSVPC